VRAGHRLSARFGFVLASLMAAALAFATPALALVGTPVTKLPLNDHYKEALAAGDDLVVWQDMDYEEMWYDYDPPAIVAYDLRGGTVATLCPDGFRARRVGSSRVLVRE
jgi:hypothetical protein